MVLNITNLTKNFGSKNVLNNIDLHMNAKEIIAFVGANGAGKTTLMKCILGFIPFEGSIEVLGEAVTFGETPTNAHIGFLPDVPQFYGFYNAQQYLKLCQQVTGEVPDARIEEMLALVGLADRPEKIRTYSRGMKQRLGIAQALLHKPKLLICDEPTSALDPEGREQILRILQAAKEETAILFSTHILSEAERISDRMVVFHDHEIKFDGPLQREISTDLYYIECTPSIGSPLQEKYRLVPEGEGWFFQQTEGQSKEHLLQELLTDKYLIEKVQPQTSTLEQFLKEVTSK